MIAVSTFDHYRFIPQIRPEDPALTKGRVNGRSSNHGGIFFVGGWGRHGNRRRLAALRQELLSQKNDEFRYHKNTKIAEVKYVPYHTRVFAHKFLPPTLCALSHDTQLCVVVVSLFPFPKPKADATLH